jgi:acyl dehydratase
MRYLEDLFTGFVTDCGSFAFTRKEIISFARRYDPQPFHLDDDAARRSLFGRLTASGLHSASAGRRLVLQAALQDIFVIGSPGAKRLQMHKPVYADDEIRISHTSGNIEWLDEWPGVGLVEGVTQGFDTSGNLVMTIHDLEWVGSRSLPKDFNVNLLSKSQGASMPLGALQQVASIAPFAEKSEPDEHIYLEDCRVDSSFISKEYAVTAAEIAGFHAEFDPRPTHHGSRHSANEWHGTCLGMRVIAEAFWNQSENVGGSGTDFVRWPVSVRAGDRLRGELRIVHTRPLRTRPGLGLVKADCICINQLAEVISSFSVTTFLRMRPEG